MPRLAVSLLVTRFYARLEPLDVFGGKRVPLSPATRCDNSAAAVGNYPAFAWWLDQGRRLCRLFTRTPVKGLRKGVSKVTRLLPALLDLLCCPGVFR